MSLYRFVPDVLRGLWQLDARELTVRLRRYIDGAGGHVTPSDLEVARELVRRARRVEELESLLKGGHSHGS
jgi:hypothetical protein